MPGSSAAYMAQAAPLRSSGAEERETFQKFFECWLVEQNQHLEELVSASKENEQQPQEQGRTVVTDQEEEEEEEEGLGLDERILRQKTARVIEHYEQYYRAKSRWAKNDVLSMFNPSWRSSLEEAFLWIGGWRPTMAFHLLYSKSGLQLEARLDELIQGLTTGDLGDLSPTQLNQVNELHKATIREEKEITEKLAKQQEAVADSSMVELSHNVTELMRERAQTVVDGDRIEATLATKEEGLAQVLQKADDLRLKTLKQVLNILTPIQGVHFLIAAAELHLRLHDWGKKREARQHQAGEVGRAHQQ